MVFRVFGGEIAENPNLRPPWNWTGYPFMQAFWPTLNSPDSQFTLAEYPIRQRHR